MSDESNPSPAKVTVEQPGDETVESKNEAIESKDEVIEPLKEEPDAAASKTSVADQAKSTSLRKARGRRNNRTGSPAPDGIVDAVIVSSPSSDSESDVSTTGSTSDSEADVRKASKLNNASLFEAYARRLGHKPGPELKKSLRTRGRKGPRLIAGFVDYVHSLESRIHSLESQLDRKKPDDDDDDKANASDEEPTAPESGPVIKFFHIDEEVDVTGRFKTDRTEKPNTYRSSVAPHHFIRALYRWKSEKSAETTQTIGDDEMPNPRDIEVVGIRIDSIGVANFFRKTTHFYATRPDVTELYKPFRSIIRNLGEFRAHLAKLESDWEAATNNKSDGDVKDLGSKEQVDANGEDRAPPGSGSNTDVNQPDKPLDTADSSSEDESPEASLKTLTNFRELMKFIDTYLEPQVKLYERVRDGSAKKIAFENLWMLFNFNDTIYSPVKRGHQEVTIIEPGNKPVRYYTKPKPTPQAYRVIHSTGGVGIYFDPSLDHDSIITRESQGQELSTISVRDQFSQLIVFCFSISFNGEKYTPVEDFFVFKPFEGEVDITSLEGYPLRFHRQGEQISRMLLERGRKFIDMTAISHMTYEGLTVGDDRQEVASSVIIDIKLFYQENESERPNVGPLRTTAPPRIFNQVIEVAAPVPTCPHKKPCYICNRDVYTEISNTHKVNASLRRYLYEYEPEEKTPKLARNAIKRHMEATNFIFLLPGQVPGFALRSRKWVQLDANLLRWTLDHDLDGKQSADDAGWKDLVLPPGHKDIVLAMVKNHTASTSVLKEGVRQTSEVDLVKGKGKGCIILIHGAPGVGKTSTAECVAAYTKRPLFPITCGDIGYQPDVVEKNLDRLFYLAHRWGCVLLLDEADVFLAKRSKEDIKRNGLVSIFLRTLEYYSGILFLTTNRVGMIDDAFRSRLHLTLYYPKLDRAQSRKIWKVNLRRLRELNAERGSLGRPKVRIDKEKILAYADLNFEELRWNGRQIRNAFQSALALADFKAQDASSSAGGGRAAAVPTLSVEQFQTIATASHEFDYYLQVTHGFDEEKIAARDRTRGAYKHSESRKLKSLPLSDDDDDDESEDSSSSDSDAGEEVLPSQDSDNGSDSDRERSSAARKKGGKKKKKEKKQTKKTSGSKKHKKDEAKSERSRKGKEKARDSGESENSSDGDD
ncbi:hypothetical protein Hte_000190 [Hypoxylon texense]